MKKTINSILAVLVFTAIGLGQPENDKLYQQDLLKTASAFEMSGRFDVAAEKYIQFSKTNPKNMSGYLGAKRCLLRLGDYEKLESFILSLQKVRRDIRYEVDLAEIKFLRGDEKEALKYWDKILIENSKTLQAYSLIASQYQQHSLFDKAIDIYQKARKSFKDQRMFVFELADLYNTLADYQAMVFEYLDYLQLNKTQINFIDSRIAAAGQTDEAKEKITKALKKALREKPELQPFAFQLLGAQYLRSKDYGEALSCFQKLEAAVDTTSTNGPQRNPFGAYLFNFANVALMDGQTEYAEKAFQLLIGSQEKSVYTQRAEYGMAQLYEKRKLYDQAVAAYKDYYKKYPKTAEGLEALLRIGDIQYNTMLDLKGAVETFTNISQNRAAGNYRLEALQKLSECYISLGEIAKAKTTLQQVIALSGGGKTEPGKQAIFTLAQLDFYSGQPTLSIKKVENLLTLTNTDNPDIYENDGLELLFFLKQNSVDSTAIAEFGKAKLLNRQKKFIDSNNLLDRLVENSPQLLFLEDVWFLQAENFQLSGEYNLAIGLLKKIQTDENSVKKDEALYKTAIILQENLSDFEKASKEFESLLVEFPNSIYIEDARQRIRQMITQNEIL